MSAQSCSGLLDYAVRGGPCPACTTEAWPARPSPRSFVPPACWAVTLLGSSAAGLVRPSSMLKHVLSALGGAVVGAAVYSMRETEPPLRLDKGQVGQEEDAGKSAAPTAASAGAPPPPPSAFFMYCEDNAERARRENPGHHQIQGVLQQEWERMSDAEREPYEQQLAERRAEYTAAAGELFAQPKSFVGDERFELPEPGPMLPPVPAVILGVAGDEEHPADLTIVWSFILDGPNAQIGISVGDDSMITFEEHAGLSLIRKHRCFTLNVPDAGWIEQFDRIDMTASTREDKLEAHGLTMLESVVINPETPGIAEAAVVLECEVVEEHRLPPCRSIFFANVVRTTVHPGVTDSSGKLDSTSRPFFGMTAGNGEFWTWGHKVGHIGMSVGRDDIRY